MRVKTETAALILALGALAILTFLLVTEDDPLDQLYKNRTPANCD